MSEVYDDLPTQGTHRGDESKAEENEVTVRAQQPPTPADQTSEAPERTFRLSHNQEQGTYRVRAWAPDELEEPGEGYEEEGRYASTSALQEALNDLPEAPRYVVLENTESGEVQVAREKALSDDWTESGRFDQFTVFEDQDDAAAYADQQRESSGAQG